MVHGPGRDRMRRRRNESFHKVIHSFAERPPLKEQLRDCLLAAWLALVTAPAIASPPPDAADLMARAEAGEPWAQLNLGAAFDHGLAGFPLDPVRAVAWYRRAAEAGLAEAQFNLAHCLATGSGTRQDNHEALHWMLRAARQGLPSAQFLAGVMYAEGMGTPVDHARAREWLRRAADNGHLDARSLLERLLERSGADTVQPE